MPKVYRNPKDRRRAVALAQRQKELQDIREDFPWETPEERECRMKRMQRIQKEIASIEERLELAPVVEEA